MSVPTTVGFKEFQEKLLIPFSAMEYSHLHRILLHSQKYGSEKSAYGGLMEHCKEKLAYNEHVWDLKKNVPYFQVLAISILFLNSYHVFKD